jgi:hypothetical protein
MKYTYGPTCFVWSNWTQTVDVNLFFPHASRNSRVPSSVVSTDSG